MSPIDTSYDWQTAIVVLLTMALLIWVFSGFAKDYNKMLTASEIDTELKEILTRVSGKQFRIMDNHNLFDDLHLDSLDCLEVLLEIETKFQIDLDDADITTTKTVGQLKNVIAAKFLESL